MATTTPVVLAVDDEAEVLETYQLWLGEAFDIRTADNGWAALEQLDEQVDVVLLDRIMPGLSGDEVLERIEDHPADPQIVMLTALDPDFDVIDMGFDAYVRKPVTKEILHSTIQTVLRRSEYAWKLRRYYSLVERRSVLQATKEQSVLDDSEQYQALVDRIEDVESDLGNLVTDIDHNEFVAIADELG